MPWKGITDNQDDIGNGLRYVQNSSFFTMGELRRRLGFGGRIAQTGIVVGEQSNYLLYVTAAGAIVANDGTTPTTLLSGYNVVSRPALQQAFGRMHFINDFDAMRVSDDGTTIRTAGITGPVTAPTLANGGAGNSDVGTRYVRYRWYDSRRMRYSNPSDASSIVLASASIINGTNIVCPDSTIDTIIWEMTPVGVGTWYQVASVANSASTTALSISDVNLVNRTPAGLYGDWGHNPPPLASIICEHQTYIFLWGATSRTFTGCGVTNASPTITGTGFSTQWAGRQVTVAGTSGTFYVSSATTTTITLTANFTGTTSASATITVASGAPDLLCWSQPGQPESFDTTALARRISLQAGDSPSAMLSLHGDLYLIGQRSMRRLNLTNDPSTGQLVPVPSTLGAFHQRCVITDAGNNAFGWGRNGMWMISAMLPERISDPILTSTVSGLIDTTRVDERFVVWEPVERAALFFFCAVGDSACKYAAAYYVDAKQWQIWKFRQAMTAACINGGYVDRTRLLLVDSNGSSWRYGVCVNDGLDNGSITAGASTTTTVIQGATAVVGQVLYRPLTGEERFVSAVTPTTITLASALATTPAQGEALYLGSIQQQWTTEWGTSKGLADKKHPRYLLLAVHPTTTNGMGTAKVYFYLDFSATATGVTGSQSDQWPTGITPASSLNFMYVNLDLAVVDGFVAVPLPSNWERSISATVIAEQPLDQLRWLDFHWSINGRPDEVSDGASEGE